MKKSFALLVCLFLAQACFGTFSATAQPLVQAAQQQDPNQLRVEYDAQQVVAKEKDPAKKYSAAQDFLVKYPNSTYAPYVKKDLNRARFVLAVDTYRTAQKFDDEFKVADELLKDAPENKPKEIADRELAMIVTLVTDADYFALSAKNQPLVDIGVRFAEQGIAMIDGGKKIDGVVWETEKPKYLAKMHRLIGITNLRAKKFDDAATRLAKSIEGDCSDPNTYYLMASIYRERYNEAATKYNGIAVKTSPEATEALNQAKAQADKIAEFMARTIIVCQKDKEAAKYEKLISNCKADMEAFYKVSHDGKTDGIAEYQEGLKASTCAK